MDTNWSVRAEELSAGALAWLVDAAREDGAGLAWPSRPGDDETMPTLYSGTAGIVLALLEAHAHFGDDRYGEVALRGARNLVSVVDAGWEDSSLYFGLTGIAVALHAVHERLDDKDAGDAAGRALDLVRRRFDGTRWGPLFELLGGNAGIALGALAVGDPDLALLAVEPYPRTAETTAHGVNWETRVGRVARQHHISHGTLGIVAALTAVGRTTGRDDLVELAVAGAADVVSRDEDGPAGFLVAHSHPPDRPELIDRYNFGWCQGPAGDAQVFRLLHNMLGDERWSALADRCWYTVTHCGLPERLRPRFWDNNGHCCGTAGVLALACDRAVERGDGWDFAELLAADLAAHATVDDAGTRWSNVEHRATPSELPPHTGWAMGNAGIVRELLRFARIGAGRDAAYAVTWPDQPPARSV
ncbi:MAG: lanthionine synthetase LanC family protein [Actinocatenispora sp.]